MKVDPSHPLCPDVVYLKKGDPIPDIAGDDPPEWDTLPEPVFDEHSEYL